MCFNRYSTCADEIFRDASREIIFLSELPSISVLLKFANANLPVFTEFAMIFCLSPGWGKRRPRKKLFFPGWGNVAREKSCSSRVWETSPEKKVVLPGFGKRRLRKKLLFPSLGNVAREKSCSSRVWETSPEKKVALPKFGKRCPRKRREPNLLVRLSSKSNYSTVSNFLCES